MPRRFPRGLVLVALTVQAALVAGSQQGPALRVVSAAPSGVLDQLADADQIRIVFSEPMVAIGTLADGAAPWVRFPPAAAGTFYWSGTKTLIFSPDASQPLPFATRVTVRIDGSAAALSGRRLGTPYELTLMSVSMSASCTAAASPAPAGGSVSAGASGAGDV